MNEIIKYQEIDKKLRQLEGELNSSLNRKNAAEMQQYLKDGQAKLIRLEESAKNLTEQYQKALKLYNEFVAKLEILSKNVESVETGKIDELEAIIQNYNKMSENLDNNINILGGRIASITKEYENIISNAKKARHNLEIYKSNFNKEKEKLEPEILKLKEEKSKQKAKVDPKLLAKYNAKFESKIFPVFVPETRGGCGGCRMEIPAGKMSQLKANGMVECENCGRIIYVKE